MGIKGFVDRAGEAAASAAKKAQEVAASAVEQVKSSAGSAVASQQEMAGLAKGIAAVAAERFAELKELGSEKVQTLIAAFRQALPAIRTAGYELTEFEVELGVTPKLVPHFRQVPGSPKDLERARELLRDNAIGTLFLVGLVKAGEVQKQIHVAGFQFTHIEIELGVIPSVRLQYKNDGSDAARTSPALPPAPAILISDSSHVAIASNGGDGADSAGSGCQAHE